MPACVRELRDGMHIRFVLLRTCPNISNCPDRMPVVQACDRQAVRVPQPGPPVQAQPPEVRPLRVRPQQLRLLAGPCHRKSQQGSMRAVHYIKMHQACSKVLIT